MYWFASAPTQEEFLDHQAILQPEEATKTDEMDRSTWNLWGKPIYGTELFKVSLHLYEEQTLRFLPFEPLDISSASLKAWQIGNRARFRSVPFSSIVRMRLRLPFQEALP